MMLKLLSPQSDFKQIAAIWQNLARKAGCAYFLSWGWMENWLACLPETEKPQLAVIMEDNRPRAAFFIKKTLARRHRLIKSRIWHVNTMGKNRFDDIWIEYNKFLCHPDFKISFSDIIKLLPEPWDEIWLPGLDTNAFPGNQLDQSGPYVTMVTDKSASPYVDLEKVRQKEDYLALLSKNTRAQIRRAERLYEKSYGLLALDEADSTTAAADIFNELMRLHRATWQKRQTRSPFAGAYVQRFHKRLIEKRFGSGEIQLLRLRAGHHTIGCLYNLVLNGKIDFYQSGMNYENSENDKRFKPGLVTHARAIKQNAAAGYLTYDFLGGESRYKKSLATNEASLLWGRIQKKHLRFKLENRLKAIKKRFQTNDSF